MVSAAIGAALYHRGHSVASHLCPTDAALLYRQLAVGGFMARSTGTTAVSICMAALGLTHAPTHTPAHILLQMIQHKHKRGMLGLWNMSKPPPQAQTAVWEGK